MSPCACCGDPAAILLQVADREWNVCLGCAEAGIQVYDGDDAEETPLLEFRLPVKGDEDGDDLN
jgi:hypothetical protein